MRKICVHLLFEPTSSILCNSDNRLVSVKSNVKVIGEIACRRLNCFVLYLRSPYKMMLGLCRQTEFWTLPGTVSFGLVIVHFSRPIHRHVYYFKHGTVPVWMEKGKI